MRVDETRASLFWESEAAGCVEAALSSEATPTATRLVRGVAEETRSTVSWPAGSPPDVPGTYFVNRVDLAALAAGTCYRYRLFDGAAGRFCTARPAGAPLRFLAIGDTNPVLGATVPLLGQVLPRGPDFTIHLGDLQYHSSVAESWAYWFGAMEPLLRAGAFFPCIGNHEDESGDGTELASFYGRLFARPAGGHETRWYRFSSGGVYFFSLDTEEELGAGSPQHAWFAASLADAAARPGFRLSVVYMHRPMYTLGTSARRGLRPVLEPLFRALRAPVIFAGHAHGYERFEVDGLLYVVSGGGGGLLGDVDAQAGDHPDELALRRAAANRFHAVWVEVGQDRLAGEAVDRDGVVFDRFEWPVP
jgi:hypothetical protein